MLNFFLYEVLVLIVKTFVEYWKWSSKTPFVERNFKNIFTKFVDWLLVVSRVVEYVTQPKPTIATSIGGSGLASLRTC
jgi:hypothetical protein